MYLRFTFWLIFLLSFLIVTIIQFSKFKARHSYSIKIEYKCSHCALFFYVLANKIERSFVSRFIYIYTGRKLLSNARFYKGSTVNYEYLVRTIKTGEELYPDSHPIVSQSLAYNLFTAHDYKAWHDVSERWYQ